MNRISAIIITGATGFAGGRIAEYLKLQYPSIRIVGTGRNTSRKAYLESLGIEVKIGDLGELDFIQEIIEEHSVVIHCAALSSPWGKQRDFETANIEITRNLLKIAEIKYCQKFIFISSPSIYFNFKDRLNIGEDDSLPLKMANYYADTKLRAEKIVNQSKLFTVSLRPRAIIGRGDTVILPRVLAAYYSSKLKQIGKGQNTVDFTNALNLASAVHLCIENNAINKMAFNITNGEPQNLWQTLNYLLIGLNLKPIKSKIPYQLALFVANIMELYSKNISKKEPVLTKYGIGILAKTMTLNIEKARKLLGYIPLQTTKEGVDEYILWHLKNKKQ